MVDLNRNPTPREIELKNIGDLSFNEMREEIIKLRKERMTIINARERFAHVAHDLRDIAKQLGSLASELMPEFGDSTRTRVDYSESEEYLRNLLQKGSSINKELISKAFPDLQPWNINQLFDKLRKLPNVIVEGEGRRGDPMSVRMKR